MYKFKANEKTLLPPTMPHSSRGRRQRASSPSKKDKSPRKSRTSKKDAARQANEALQSTLDAASTAGSESVDAPSVNGDKSPSPVAVKTSKRKEKEVEVAETEDVTEPVDDDDKNITISVQSTTEKEGEVEKEQTTVSVKMPTDLNELPPPENMEQVIADAKRMVEEARKLEDDKGVRNKRKAEALDEEDEEPLDDNEENGVEEQPTKKVKLMEQEVKKQKVRNRALLGVAASLAIGYVLSLFENSS
jgi:hypothetical protein